MTIGRVKCFVCRILVKEQGDRNSSNVAIIQSHTMLKQWMEGGSMSDPRTPEFQGLSLSANYGFGNGPPLTDLALTETPVNLKCQQISTGRIVSVVLSRKMKFWIPRAVSLDAQNNSPRPLWLIVHTSGFKESATTNAQF